MSPAPSHPCRHPYSHVHCPHLASAASSVTGKLPPSDLCRHMHYSHSHCPICPLLAPEFTACPICPLLAPEFTASLSSAQSCSPKHIVTLWPLHSPVLVSSDECIHMSTAPSVPCSQAPAHILPLSLFDLCSHLHSYDHSSQPL